MSVTVTIEYQRIVASLPLHYRLHSALAPTLSYRVFLLNPHMRNERRPPSLTCSRSRFLVPSQCEAQFSKHAISRSSFSERRAATTCLAWP